MHLDGLLLLNGGCLLLVLLLRQLEVILDLLLVESGTLQALILQASRVKQLMYNLTINKPVQSHLSHAKMKAYTQHNDKCTVKVHREAGF